MISRASVDFRVAGSEDIEEIIAFEESLSGSVETDDIEQRFFHWGSSARRESLEFYLQIGWSFVAIDRDSKKICGYFLAQPVLFYRSMTQTLWIEEAGFCDEGVGVELGKIAFGIAKDKHLQRVLVNPQSRFVRIESIRSSLKSIEVLQLKLTKDNSDE